MYHVVTNGFMEPPNGCILRDGTVTVREIFLYNIRIVFV